AVAAGSAWTTSPIELSRTIRMRFGLRVSESEAFSKSASRGPRSQASANDLAGGVILGIADDRNLAAVFAYGVGFGNTIGGVIGAFGLHVGVDFADEGADIALGKNHHRIDVSKGSEDFSAFFRWHERSALAFQRAHGVVGVNGHDQAST